MWKTEFRTAIDPPWTRLEPIRIGRVPAGIPTPDEFLLAESDDGDMLRLDLYVSPDEDFYSTRYFPNRACFWQGGIALAWGHGCYRVDCRTRNVSWIELGTYCGNLYPLADRLLVASAERLFCVAGDGTLLWQSCELGIDGVIVDLVADGVIRGRGEWDPPDGWHPFLLDLTSGERV